MWQQWMPALRMILVLTILTGVLYPALVTGIARLAFPGPAEGSLIRKDGKVIGSSVIGQNFTRPEYFHPRPSAAGNGYDAATSGGSNLGPTSSKLMDRVKQSVVEFRKANPNHSAQIPPDAVLASGSGLDPHISPGTAEAQLARVAQARGTSPDQVREMVRQHSEGRDLGLLGEPRVNVLTLNLALDERFAAKP